MAVLSVKVFFGRCFGPVLHGVEKALSSSPMTAFEGDTDL